MASALTLGVEEELHLIDLTTFRLAGRAPALLAQLPASHFSSELQRTTVETNTSVCATLTELREEILHRRQQVVGVAAAEGLGIAAVGTVPLSSADDFELTSSGRFARMQEDYRLLVDEQLICGTQFHVGVESRDIAVRAVQLLGRDLPALLALSASSPLWHGSDTGYASIRSIIWQRWPTSGMTGPMSSAAEYDDLLADLISSGVITDTKMAYFDVRPSAHVPTIELRVCDAMPLVDDAVLIAGLFRALVAGALDAVQSGREVSHVALPLHRAAMWRAARSGLTGHLLDDSPRPQPRPAAEVIGALVSRLRPHLEAQGDWEAVSELAEATLARGNSADRQRAALAERGRLADVVLQVVAETQQTGPLSPRVDPSGTDYPASAGDEAFTAGSSLRPVYRELWSALESIDASVLTERLDERDRWSTGAGMTFGVSAGPAALPGRPAAADHPRARVAAPRGGPGPAGACPGDVPSGRLRCRRGRARRCAATPPRCTTRPAGARRDGCCRGVRYARRSSASTSSGTTRPAGGCSRTTPGCRPGPGTRIAIRQLIDAVMPDLPRPPGLRGAHTAPGQLRRTLAAGTSVPDPVIALLSDGAGNSAWFEHRLLAERAGFLLAQPDDLDVARRRGDGARAAPVDVLYLRLDVELADLGNSEGRAIGAELVQAAAQGAVTLANAPGNGVADDKAMYNYVPDLIAYYLGERPLLDPVPTYRCADPDELSSVLERVADLVTKPVDGYGGGGVLIGPHASETELIARTEEIRAHPHRWIAQEVVHLSTHPTLTPSGIVPRHVDLRAFAYVSGTAEADVVVADLALTRVAPEGSMVVNSSRGGGAKDTWIVGPTTDND